MGAYWYSYAMSIEEAIQEVDVFLTTIRDKQFEYPVFYDVEESKQFELGKEKLSAIIRAFLERVESAGYFVGLYGSASSLTTHTENDIKEKYTVWLAHWCENTITAVLTAFGSIPAKVRLTASAVMLTSTNAMSIILKGLRQRG